MIERRHVLMFVTKNTQKLHHYDQIAERRRLSSPRQMLSPGNDSWHIMSFFSVYSEIKRNSIEIGLSAHFSQAEKVCEVLFWYKPNY